MLKKIVSKVTLSLLVVGFILSCASKPNGGCNAQVLGAVSVNFITSYGLREQQPDNPLDQVQEELVERGGQDIGRGIARGDRGRIGRGAADAGLGLGIAGARDVAALAERRRILQGINEAAHQALLEAARKEHAGNIDIRDVTFTLIGHNAHTQMFEYNANGTVILQDE
ncbi:MAG: hypothetical protein FWC36_04140 [Spirochaetes bacterium]|nr:hypothetical protein [Spirochaetota bacterium]